MSLESIEPEKQNNPRNNSGAMRNPDLSQRPSRDSIVRSYSEQAAAKARSARMESQKAFQDFQESAARHRERQLRRAEIESRREMGQRNDPADDDVTLRSSGSNRVRVSRPLSSQESYRRARSYAETYERERASRDAFSAANASRTKNRELIDARGSIDSRAFNEKNEIRGYTIDERDRHDPYLKVTESKSRWRSQSPTSSNNRLPERIVNSLPRPNAGVRNLTSLSDSISGKDQYSRSGSGLSGLPPFVKIAIPVIIVLFIILMFILFS